MRKPAISAVLITIFALISTPGTAIAAPPGALISNQASFEYQDLAGQTATVQSNTVQVTTAVLRSSSSLEMTRVLGNGTGTYTETVGPSACFQGGAFVNLPDPVLIGGAPIDPSQPQQVSGTAAYNLGEAVFIRLVDSDQNLDFQLVEYASVTLTSQATGDVETLRLTETGTDTGVFTGFVVTASGVPASGDCLLQGQSGTGVAVSYTDAADPADQSAASAMLDPTQRVFESRTGTVVSGALVELIDANTGMPATVYGNDGIAQFPSAITSGGTVTDSSGTSYVFAPGEYRFPVVPDGNYRIVVTPTSEYAAPSSAQESDLQNLPGAPFALGPGSFGDAFTKSGELSISYDIPVDPQTSALFLQKRTLTTVASPGDFVRYELTLENVSASGGATDVRILDQLPQELRLVPGSVRIDDLDAPDPAIDSSSMTLEFSIASLGVGNGTTLTYVAEVVAGATGSELVNRATAVADGGLISNEATAMIQLTEDLFRSTGTIIGRVVEGDCREGSYSEDQGVANIRVYLEDGRYAITDDGGRYHFEGVEPGTHVAQLDTFSVPAHYDVVGCTDNPQFAGRPDSQFVKMHRGSLLSADFYLRRKAPPEGRVDLELNSAEAESAETINYTLRIDGTGNVPIGNIDVTVLFPDGVSYLPGSMRIDGAGSRDPQEMNGALALSLPDQFGSWSSLVEFSGEIAADVNGEVATRAVAIFDTPMQPRQRTPVAETKMLREPGTLKNEGYVLDLRFDVLSAELSPQDKIKLDQLIRDWQGVRNVQIIAVGHSDSTPIAARNKHIFIDNYALSKARANSAVSYLAGALGIHHEDMQVDGLGPDNPIAENDSPEGRQKNRRVEIVMSGVRPGKASFLEVTKASSGTQMAATIGVVGEPEKARRKYELEDENAGMPASQVEPEIDTLKPGISILLPTRDFLPAISSLKISIKHEPDQAVELLLNGNRVSELNFDMMALNANKTVAVSRWKGVDLRDGENDILAIVRNADGTRAGSLRRRVDFSGAPLRAEFLPEESTLVADGKTTPVIAVRLFDRAGNKSRPGTVGAFWVSPPHRSQWDIDQARQNDLVVLGPREPTYRVGKDGVAYLELAPTSQTGEATVNLKFANFREQEVRAWLKPATRDWILVGFAEGTAGYDRLSDNAVAAGNAGFEDGYYDEGRVAFFGKGQIKGEFLLTLAYDSDRDRDANRDRFRTVVNPNEYFPLYADASEQRFEAPSQRKLYVKLERNQFYALFGDYDTGLSTAELARYERRFNGVKSEYRGENLGYTVFAAETDQAFVRDEIRGDGTSGLYRLSQAPIIMNSEIVRIEVRDRFDSGQVLSTQTMSRFLDYNLDTRDGTLYFKAPVPSRDLEFNPVYIVVEYEAQTDGVDDVVAGGRVSLRSGGDNVELGVTHVTDETLGAEGELSGVDFRWQIDERTEVKVEYADTRVTSLAGSMRGDAGKIEIEHNGERVDARAYLREVDDEFGLGYQNAADRGFRRLGADVRGEMSKSWFVEGEAMWQQNLLTSDIRNLARAQLRYEGQSFTASGGVTYASDRFDDGDTRTSELAELSVAQKFFDSRMTLRLSGSTELGSETENLDFPTRLVAGADYRIMQGLDLVAEYEEASGRDIDATMTRVGVRANPWSRTQINTSLTNEISEFGPRVFSNVGIVQGFQLTESWTFDVGLDQTDTILAPDARPMDPDRELASGSFNDDFLAGYLGAQYTSELWTATARAEYRDSDSEERTSLLFGWYRQPAAGHGLSAGLTMFQSQNENGSETVAADLKFGWAYRKADSRWSFLNRVDLIYEDTNLVSERESAWRIINNFNANRQLGAASQLSLQYAFKFVSSDFDTIEYSGYTDLVGVDLRHSFARRWDAGLNTSIYHSHESGTVDYGAGVDVGFNLARNMWLSLGYNLAGFYDSDFNEARYTAQGPFLRFSVKADQYSLKRIAGQR